MGSARMTTLLRFLLRYLKLSFSQCGEDLIVAYLMEALQISKPSYLDVGAHHPSHLNNTYLFYLKGSRGVCVEPDPELFAKLKSRRKKDVCLNIGISFDDRRSADFYIMSSNSLSTFSKEEVQRYGSYGRQRVLRVTNTPLESINAVIKRYFKTGPQFISIDTEGLDFQILKSFDFTQYRPPVFCIETLTYAEDKTEQKVTAIVDYMQQQSYLPVADTYINTVFVEADAWKNRPSCSKGDEAC
jgi:FkbM family methyltransferase